MNQLVIDNAKDAKLLKIFQSSDNNYYLELWIGNYHMQWKFKKNCLKKEFAGDTIDSRWDSDWGYDDKGMEDDDLKEFEQLMEWVENPDKPEIYHDEDAAHVAGGNLNHE